MYGREGGTTTFYQDLLDRGVPRYAAGKALRAKMRRDVEARRASAGPEIGPTYSRHQSMHRNWCGQCYEQAKGRQR